MEKKPPADDSKNRFAEVIRQSQQRRAELNNKAKKKQMEDIELPPRDEAHGAPPDRRPLTTLNPGAITLSRRVDSGGFRQIRCTCNGRSILRNERPNQPQERLMLGALPSSTQEFAYVDIGRLAA
jgi:hypothetical protein